MARGGRQMGPLVCFCVRPCAWPCGARATVDAPQTRWPHRPAVTTQRVEGDGEATRSASVVVNFCSLRRAAVALPAAAAAAAAAASTPSRRLGHAPGWRPHGRPLPTPPLSHRTAAAARRGQERSEHHSRPVTNTGTALTADARRRDPPPAAATATTAAAATTASAAAATTAATMCSCL
ncbi:hypothetical protein I4F81_000060 [Pyropia yezoensis]|uniref:Uncharacterized protein n=1 Tax=Pyropia yezoensis TaxID=2788 RepID=A0ACC3BII2_PYRYE|nr:hypothetical protein I4F81_000060 [Neopyropia yezoensis]